MPSFIKEIIRPGTYHASKADGTRQAVTLSPTRIHSIAKTFSEMRKAGLKIPAPKTHYLKQDGKLYVPSPADADRKSDDYAGHWSKTWIDPQTGFLMGRLEVPLASDAEKIGTVVTEVSPYLADYTDGTGKTWKDCLKHIALVQHPVIPGQANFQPVSEGNLEGVGMSLPLSAYAFSSSGPPAQAKPDIDNPQPTDKGTTNPPDTNEDGQVDAQEKLSEALEILKESLGLELPPDTDATNLVDRLCTAAYALRGQKDQTGSVSQPPEESEEENPIAMAITQQQLDEAVAKTRKDTELAFSTQMDALKSQLSARDSYAANQRKGDYKKRIEALINTGRCAKEYGEKTLLPMVDAYAFSVDDKGTPTLAPIDIALNALEALPQPQGVNPFTGQAFSTPPDGSAPADRPMPLSNEDVSEEEAEKTVDAFFKNTGRSH